MLDREPFLKAIFANPADDLPRLVFADYLEEQGEGEWASLVRGECEYNRFLRRPDRVEYDEPQLQEYYRLRDQIHELRVTLFPEWKDCFWQMPFHPSDFRGFRDSKGIRIEWNEVGRIREIAARKYPEWYGATQLKIVGGRISGDQLVDVLASPVCEHVIDLDLSGEVIETPAILNDIETNQGIPVFDMELRPVVNLAAVEALAQSREARRLQYLDLQNNDLDNDAARALIRSPHFLRLKRLSLFRGNRFRATVWQHLHEKYGSDVLDPAPADERL